MSKHKLFLLGSLLLVAALLFTFGPLNSKTAHAATNPAVSFANSHWNCLTAACTSRVSAGDAQPDYECAEFVSRSLAYEGFIPGLSSTSSQSAYEYYKPGNGKTYDLLLITPLSGYHTLANFLLDYGYATNIGHNLNNEEPGDVAVFETNGTPEHTALITSIGSRTTSSTKVDAHNNARYDYALSNYFSEFNGWYILHFTD